MFSLYLKEIAGFFKSITGYLVIILFLTLTGLIIWVFHGELNIMDIGYATLDPFFYIAPWMFLLLIPAITMRSVADEKKSGNLELLFTRPLTDLQIIIAKYLSCLTLVLLALIPTIIYYFSLLKLSEPPGNVDHAAIWGSYLGLFLLAAVYTAIGIFSSSLSENTIVAFLLAIVLCFAMYFGFDQVSTLFSGGITGNFIKSLSIDYHYESVSRGVIDSRDVLYFIGVTAIFIILTKIKFASRLW